MYESPSKELLRKAKHFRIARITEQAEDSDKPSRLYVFSEHGDILELHYYGSLSDDIYPYSRWKYDDQNRLVEEKHLDTRGYGHAKWVRYRYDENGRLKLEEHLMPDDSSVDGVAVTNTNAYWYDDLGRVINDGVHVFAYSTDGTNFKVLSPDGKLMSQHFLDKDGRKEKIEHFDSAGNLDSVEEFEYFFDYQEPMKHYSFRPNGDELGHTQRIYDMHGRETVYKKVVKGRLQRKVETDYDGEMVVENVTLPADHYCNKTKYNKNRLPSWRIQSELGVEDASDVAKTNFSYDFHPIDSLRDEFKVLIVETDDKLGDYLPLFDGVYDKNVTHIAINNSSLIQNWDDGFITDSELSNGTLELVENGINTKDEFHLVLFDFDLLLGSSGFDYFKRSWNCVFEVQPLVVGFDLIKPDDEVIAVNSMKQAFELALSEIDKIRRGVRNNVKKGVLEPMKKPLTRGARRKKLNWRKPLTRPRFGNLMLLPVIERSDFSNGPVQVFLHVSIPYLLFITDNKNDKPNRPRNGEDFYVKEEREIEGKTYYLFYTDRPK